MPQSPSTSPSHPRGPLEPAQAEAIQPPAETVAVQAKPRKGSPLVWLFRLLLLGAGGSLAIVAGMAVAHFYPAQTQEMPFAERLLHSSETVLRQLERLPRIWQGKSDNSLPSPAVSPANVPSAITPPTDTTPPLTFADRQKLQNELNQLQQELEQVSDRATAIENRLGTPNRSSEISERLQAIRQQLQPGASSPVPAASPGVTAIPPAATSMVTEDDRLMVTLPSDALFETDQFEADQTTLKPGTDAILNSIVSDLKQYAGATIRVTGHLDQQGTEASDRAKSFEQAKAIEQYLGGQLKEGYHWIVEGYGHSRPLSPNDTPVNRQRNRRIEIIIEPK